MIANPNLSPDVPATPILVVGFMRSGTKWLSNILCNHPAVSGVQSSRARGILETNMFHRMQAKFDLRSTDDYVGFIELWKATEFFQVLKLDANYLYSLDPRPLSFVTLFENVMENYAKSEGRRYWLQKCDPERALQVLPEIKRAKVITIRRDFISVVQSLRNITRNRDQRFSMTKAIPGITRAERLLSQVERRFDGLAVRYEQLKADPEGTAKAICAYLDIDYTDSMLEVPFEANTSFAKSRPPAINSGHRAVLHATHAASKLVPIWMLNRILGIHPIRTPAVTLVAGTFGNLKDNLKDRRDYR